jgi:hypothetical protein
MATPETSLFSLSSVWEVLTLFLIPIGGGIPAGVLLAKSRSLPWPLTALLYFISDVILACVFEPLMLLVIKLGKRSPKMAKFTEIFRQSVQKTTSVYGSHLGPLALITIAFGVDPMTGRAAAAAAGHRFVMGWMFAIAGDMLYFGVIMASTLWLNNILGDGTWTMVIILILMMVVPTLIRKTKEKFSSSKT